MSLILTSESMSKLPVQAVFTAWNYSNEERFISPLRNKWFIKRAYKKLDSGADFVKTGGYDFRAENIIHTKIPHIKGYYNQKNAVSSLYLKCLEYAKEERLRSIAIPLWRDEFDELQYSEIYELVTDTIIEFLYSYNLKVYLRLTTALCIEIDKQTVDEVYDLFCDLPRKPTFFGTPKKSEQISEPISTAGMRFQISDPVKPLPLERIIITMKKETFSEMLLRLTKDKFLYDSECYKRANIERSLFSKIKTDKNYKPSKTTAVAFAIALELDIDKARELLYKAGYTLSDSIVFDIIITYAIENKIYDIYKVNELLFCYRQPLLGSK